MISTLLAALGILAISGGALYGTRPAQALVTRLGRLRARLARFRRLRKVPGRQVDGRPLDAAEMIALGNALASWRCLTVAEPRYGQQGGRRP